MESVNASERIKRLEQQASGQWKNPSRQEFRQIAINGTLTSELARGGSATITRDDNGGEEDVVDNNFLRLSDSPLPVGTWCRFIRIGPQYELITFDCP